MTLDPMRMTFAELQASNIAVPIEQALAAAKSVPSSRRQTGRPRKPIVTASNARRNWWLVEQTVPNGECPPYVTSVNPRGVVDPAQFRITPMVHGPVKTSDNVKMIAFPIAEYRKNETSGVVNFDIVGWELTEQDQRIDFADYVQQLPERVNVKIVSQTTAERFGQPAIYVLRREHRTDDAGRTSDIYRTLLTHVVDISRLGESFRIDTDRSLKRIPGTLGYEVINRSLRGTVTEFVDFADMRKPIVSALWPSATELDVDITDNKDLGMVGQYSRLKGRANTDQRLKRVKGLGPVRCNDATVFVSGSTSFITETGQPTSDFELAELKPTIEQFGVTLGTPRSVLSLGYERLSRILDLCPDTPGLPASILGVMLLAPLATLDIRYRTMVYNHGAPESGKTEFAKLLLVIQSHTNRESGTAHETTSMRTGYRGSGSTSNGALMDLQSTGGFFPLIDDYIQRNSDDEARKRRFGGLNELLSALYGEGASKQNWGKYGPEFAKTFSPQSSFLINGEESIIPSGDRGVLRRLIELQGPETPMYETGGFNGALMDELYGRSRLTNPDANAVLVSPQVPDSMHRAWSDLCAWQFRNQDIVRSLYAQSRVSLSDALPNMSDSLQRHYAIALTGIAMMSYRAAELDVMIDTTPVLDAIAHVANIQEMKLSTGHAFQPAHEVIRDRIRQCLSAGTFAFPGPPVWSDDTKRATKAYTQPGRLATQTTVEPVRNDPRKPLPPTVSEATAFPEYPAGITSLRHLGMTDDSDGTETMGRAMHVGGYLIPPCDSTKGGHPRTEWLIYVPKSDQTLANVVAWTNQRAKNSADTRQFTVREFINALTDANVATEARAMYHIRRQYDNSALIGRKATLLSINAEWLFADDESTGE